MTVGIAARAQPPLHHLLADAVRFWWRNQTVFWITALPITLLAAGIEYFLESDYSFSGTRSHWNWDLVFALVYALFLDRWQKEALLDGAAMCEAGDELRGSVIGARFLFAAVAAFVLAFILSKLPVLSLGGTLPVWKAPGFAGLLATTLLPRLPHVIAWALAVASLALLLPALSAGAAVGLARAWKFGRPVRTMLFGWIVVAALLSLIALSGAAWGADMLPRKPWAPALLSGLARLVDCLLLSLTGSVLVSIWRQLTGWQAPEPADRPYPGMRVRRRSS